VRPQEARASSMAIKEMGGAAWRRPGPEVPQQRLQAHHTIAQLSAYQGNVDKADPAF